MWPQVVVVDPLPMVLAATGAMAAVPAQIVEVCPRLDRAVWPAVVRIPELAEAQAQTMRIRAAPVVVAVGYTVLRI